MVILLNNLVREKTNPAFKECVKKKLRGIRKNYIDTNKEKKDNFINLVKFKKQ